MEPLTVEQKFREASIFYWVNELPISLYVVISKIWRVCTFLPLIITYLLGSNAFATECPLPLSIQNHTETVWPYLSNIEITGIFDEPVSLRSGQYEGLPFVPNGHARPQLRLWPELMVSADLDGQGGDEKIGLISETSGGSGERVYLIVAMEEAGQYRALPASLLGDRVKVRSMEVRDGRILVRIIEAGPDQPMCCGTQLSQLAWQVENGRLVLKDRLVQGEVSLEILQNKQWYLLDRPGDRANAVHPSCTRLRILANQLVLNVNGQSYSAAVNEISPGHIVLSDAALDLNNDDTPYVRLVSDLMTVSQYTFRAGRLLLSGKVKDRRMNFEFVASP